MLCLFHEKLTALLPLSLQQLIQTLGDASHSCCTAAVPCMVASISGRTVGTITVEINSGCNSAAMCWASRYTVCIANLHHSTITFTARSHKPCVWYLSFISHSSFYLLKQWPGCVAEVQLVMLQNCWNHWKCYGPPFLQTVYLTSFVPLLMMDSAGCQACVEHSHHSETCQQNTQLTLHNNFQHKTRKHFWPTMFTSISHFNLNIQTSYTNSNSQILYTC